LQPWIWSRALISQDGFSNNNNNNNTGLFLAANKTQTVA
jgi:hypothetical protein